MIFEALTCTLQFQKKDLQVLLKSIIVAKADWSKLHHCCSDLSSLAYECLAKVARESSTVESNLEVSPLSEVGPEHCFRTPVTKNSTVGRIATPPTKNSKS